MNNMFVAVLMAVAVGWIIYRAIARDRAHRARGDEPAPNLLRWRIASFAVIGLGIGVAIYFTLRPVG